VSGSQGVRKPGCQGEAEVQVVLVFRSYREVEGVGVLTQLLQQPLLQPARRCRLRLLQRREGLEGADVQVFPEGKAQHVQVLPAVAERTRQRHKH